MKLTARQVDTAKPKEKPYKTAPKENLIRLPEVQRRTGYSKAWIYKLISDGEFPKQIKLGSRSIAFIESEIDNWIAQRIAGSRAA